MIESYLYGMAPITMEWHQLPVWNGTNYQLFQLFNMATNDVNSFSLMQITY